MCVSKNEKIQMIRTRWTCPGPGIKNEKLRDRSENCVDRPGVYFGTSRIPNGHSTFF